LNLLAHDREFCEPGGPCEGSIEGSPWLRRYGFETADMLTQYWASMQFSLALLTGSQVPMEPGRVVERIFTVTMMLFGTFVSCFVVGEFILIMDRQGEAKHAYTETTSQARNFMAHRSVPLDVQTRVYRYLEASTKSNATVSRDFIGKLSSWLQIELIEVLNSAQLRRHDFFSRIQDGVAMRRLCLESTTLYFAPGDLVFEEGHPAQSMHFLVRGKLRAHPNSAGDGGRVLKPPCWLGAECVFTNQSTQQNTVKAVLASENLVIEKSLIMSCCEASQDFKMLYNDFRVNLLGSDGQLTTCKLCLDVGHSEEQCPWKTQQIEDQEDRLKNQRRSSATSESTRIRGSRRISNVVQWARGTTQLSETSIEDQSR